MKVLISGVAGFVGRHMARELLRRGDYVVGFDHSWTNAWGPNFRKIGDGIPTGKWHGMRSSCDQMYREVIHFKDQPSTWDLVIHCAYHVGGRAGIDGNRWALAKNVALDAALFDWAVRSGQPRVLYFSSSAVYPWEIQDTEERRLVEDDVDLDKIETPDADYGLAKLLGERLARNARALGVHVHVVRPFSGYGEGQTLDYPFPSIVARARGGDLSVWGPPGQTRDWIHIDDVVRGALAIVEHDVQEPINLCTGRAVEMGSLARMVYGICKDEHTDGMAQNGGMSHRDCKDCQVTYLPDKPTGVHYRVGAPQRMLRYYEPQVTLEEGIRRALAL